MTTPSGDPGTGSGTDPAGALLDALGVARELGEFPAELLIAYSGGVDSTCLLACAVDTIPAHRLPVRAVHVDHGWSPHSPDWARFCVETARQLGVVCEVHRLGGNQPLCSSREAWAREQRYAALQSVMVAGSAVLTAHHQDDQAETFLLMALRGSGPRGLAGIAPRRAFGSGFLLRPFLDTPAADLRAFAAARGLNWLDDPSNAVDAFDRNFLRARVLPLLQQRWPAASATLARSAGWQRGMAQLEADDEAALLKAAGAQEVLSVSALMERPREAALRLLRGWIRACRVPIPSAGLLERVFTEVLPARVDRYPVLRWQDWALRRHRDVLHLTLASPPALDADLHWDWRRRIELPVGTLEAVEVTGAGIARRALQGRQLSLRRRKGGELFRLAGQNHHRSLKHLWQSAGVPPWQRDTTPLVFLDDSLIAVPGLGYAAAVAPLGDEPAVAFVWRPSTGVLPTPA